jgi:hypothetical protein
VEVEEILAHPEMDAGEPPQRRLAGIQPAEETLAVGCGDARAQERHDGAARAAGTEGWRRTAWRRVCVRESPEAEGTAAHVHGW